MQSPPWPDEHDWLLPNLLATPSVNKTILLDVIQSKVPLAVSSSSAFLIPSWILVLPFAVNAFMEFIKSACPVDNVNGFTIEAVLLYFTIEILFFPVGLLAARNTLLIKSIAASWAWAKGFGLLPSPILPETSITKTTSSGLETGFVPWILSSTSIFPHTPGRTVTVFVGVIVCAKLNTDDRIKRSAYNSFFIPII